MCRNEQISENLSRVKEVLKDYLDKDCRFTGKIVFSLNCHNGGIGNLETYVQKKIENNA